MASLPTNFADYDKVIQNLKRNNVSDQKINKYMDIWDFEMRKQGNDPAEMHKEWMTTKATKVTDPAGPFLTPQAATKRGLEAEAVRPGKVEEFQQLQEQEGPFLTPETVEQRDLSPEAVRPEQRQELIQEQAKPEPGIVERFKTGFIEGAKESEESKGQLQASIKAREISPSRALAESGLNIAESAGLPFIRALEQAVVDPVVGFAAEQFPKVPEAILDTSVGKAIAEGGVEAFLEPINKLFQTDQGREVQKQVQGLANAIQTLPEEDKATVSRILNTLDIGTSATVGAIVKQPIKGAVKTGARIGGEILEEGVEAGTRVVGKAKSLFTRPSKSVDELIGQADAAIKTPEAPPLPEGATPAQIRKRAEETAPKLSLREKFVGVRPDIKRRIQGKQERLSEFFDIANARNLDDTVATPLEFAAEKVGSVRDTLQGVLNDTGSDIGKFRNKISTLKVGIDDLNKVQKAFDDALKPLNLTLDKKGNIIRVKGKVSSKVKSSEIKLLQSLREDVLTVKSSPSVENLIDLRNTLDKRINFEKSSREISNVVDPLSRSVRGVIKDVNLGIIGKEQGKLLSDYSTIINVLDDLNKVVDSKSGAEFLLKKVLSEKGRMPRELIEKIKELTGVDLMDDAVMAQLATELIGNDAQKGLFRSEIKKAGLDALDVVDIISGAPGGIIKSIKTIAPRVISPDVEKTFLRAAE